MCAKIPCAIHYWRDFCQGAAFVLEQFRQIKWMGTIFFHFEYGRKMFYCEQKA